MELTEINKDKNGSPFQATIVIPAYNHAEVLECGLEYLVYHTNQSKYSFEIVVVDDGSRDSAVKEVAEKYNCRVIVHSVNQGKGGALVTGVLNSFSKVIVTIDNDVPFFFSEIEEMVEAVDADKADLVVGSRYDNLSYFNKISPLRAKLSQIFKFFSNFILKLDQIDCQCGLKAFNVEAAHFLFKDILCKGFAFDIEILFKAMLFKMRIKSVPVTIRTMSSSTVRLLVDGLKMTWDIFRIKYFYSQFSYKNRMGKIKLSRKTNSF
tara:strand:+ start:163418 stop:164212 length:795 start_codon:yes stop_codon:yes gene_type:complete